jgi:hypothetical protein
VGASRAGGGGGGMQWAGRGKRGVCKRGAVGGGCKRAKGIGIGGVDECFLLFPLEHAVIYPQRAQALSQSESTIQQRPHQSHTYTHTHTHKQVFPTFELCIQEAPVLPANGAEGVVLTEDYEADEVRAGAEAPRSL